MYAFLVCVTETHIQDFDNNENLYALPGHSFIHKKRKSGKGGGVGIYVRNTLNFKHRQDINTHLESLWIEIFAKSAKYFFIGCYYRPPEGSKYYPKDFYDAFDKQLNKVVKYKKETIILGDFNIDFNKSVNKNFKTTLETFGSTQVIKKSMRTTDTSSTLIDLIITNHPERLTEVNVFANHIADHDMVACSRKTRGHRPEGQRQVSESIITKKTRDS